MFSFFTKRRAAATPMCVNYPALPRLPNSATGILEHAPLASAPIMIQPKQLALYRLTPGTPYSMAAAEHQKRRFADALFLEALLAKLFPAGQLSSKAVAAYLGNFTGQIFFLGTTFDTAEGPSYAFLNWNTILPATCYLCREDTSVRPDIPVYACAYTE